MPAADQLQHDIVGPLLDAALLHENAGGMASLRLWREVRHLVDTAIYADEANVDDAEAEEIAWLTQALERALDRDESEISPTMFSDIGTNPPAWLLRWELS